LCHTGVTAGQSQLLDNAYMPPNISISIRLSGVKNVLKWTASTRIQPDQLGPLCEGLRQAVLSRNGAVFYYPKMKTRSNTCRYEWLIPWGQKKLGMQVGIMFPVSSSNLTEITLYAAYPKTHPQFGTVPDFSDSEGQQCVRSILQVWEDAQQITVSTEQNYHLVTYLELPPALRIGNTVQCRGFTVMPTVYERKSNRNVSALIITTPGKSEEDAKQRAANKNMFVAAALTLQMGLRVKSFYVSWPRGAKAPVVLPSVAPLPENATLYPSKGMKFVHPHRADVTAFTAQLSTICDMFDRLPDRKRDKFINSLWAYASGAEVLHTEPTLASVAFLASLSIFGEPEACDGTVTCSRCGQLSMRHNLVGERAAITNGIAKLLAAVPNSELYAEVEGVLKRVYTTQRSSYVHGAQLRHNEITKQEAISSQPTAAKPYSSVHVFGIDLAAVAFLGRKVLLLGLSDASGITIDHAMFGIESKRVLVEGVGLQMRLPPRTIAELILKEPAIA
jgi:hypothetical protein